jgi:hypothetical protein
VLDELREAHFGGLATAAETPAEDHADFGEAVTRAQRMEAAAVATGAMLGGVLLLSL